MAKIHNPTIRKFCLPARAGHGKLERIRLHGQSTIEVPDEYLDALFAETNRKGKPTGWARRLERVEGGARVRRPRGAAGAFNDLVIAKRAGKEIPVPSEAVELPATEEPAPLTRGRRRSSSTEE